MKSNILVLKIDKKDSGIDDFKKGEKNSDLAKKRIARCKRMVKAIWYLHDWSY